MLGNSSMVYTCRCGGSFVIEKDDFEDFNGTIETQTNCASDTENCDCHEIIEVECDTCSLVIGIKIVNQT